MKKSLKYIFIFVLLSLVGHSYVIYKFYHDGILFTGPNDGMEQMVPIQMFLFNQWSHGNWFYSSDFWIRWRLLHRFKLLLFYKYTFYYQRISHYVVKVSYSFRHISTIILDE